MTSPIDFMFEPVTAKTSELTAEQWALLRAQLAAQAEPTHHESMPMYASADRCPHPIREEDQPDGAAGDDWPSDGVHVWGGEDGELLICLESPRGEGCGECQDEVCHYRDPEVAAERRADAWFDLCWRLGMES